MLNWLQNLFPYTNFHELNADWLLKTTKEAAEKAEQAYNIAEPLPDIVDELDNRLNEAEGRIGRLVDNVFDLEPFHVDFTALNLTRGYITTDSTINCNHTSAEIQTAVSENRNIVARVFVEEETTPRYVSNSMWWGDFRTVPGPPTDPTHVTIHRGQGFTFPLAGGGVLRIYNASLVPTDTWTGKYWKLTEDTEAP